MGLTSPGRTPPGLTSLLMRAGARRLHVLLVPAVGGTGVRLAVERELTRRGWLLADTPADADLVVVAGRAGAELAGVVERIWAQVPEPRTRIALSDPDPGVIAAALQNAAASLADPAHPQPQNVPDQSVADTDSDDLEQRDQDDTHVGHDGDSDENTRDDAGGDGDMAGDMDGDMGGDMEMPGGLAMADLGADRDGLRLDRLHVSLGPVLPEWPAGLVVRVTLQGDVIQEARVEVVDSMTGGMTAGADARWWVGAGRAAARELDALARFLSVAGWADAAAWARHVRDDLLIGVPPGHVAASAAALVRRVRRSRTLRWMVRDIRAGERGGLDVLGRLERRLDAVTTAIADPDAPPPQRPPVGQLPGLLVGTEFAAARLIVAVLDPDTESHPAPMFTATTPTATTPTATAAPAAGEPGGHRDGGTGSGRAHG